MTDTSSQCTQTAVLGLGALGSALAGALLAAGRSTTVWNRTGGRAAADEGTLEVLAAAVDHLVVTSVQAGIGTDVPDGVRAIGRGIAAGHGHDGPASLVEAIRVDR
jgi:hypothetical protein